jgi:GNAT superfamily N-acetyltransferase
MFELTVIPADPHEEPFAAAMLAELYGHSLTAYLARVANATVGAVAIDWVNREAAARFRIHVHVLPAFRRQGIGRRIVDRVAAMVSGETDALGAFTTLPEDSDAAAFASACGFTVRKRLLHFRMDGAPLVANLEGLLSRLEARGRVPASLRVVPAREAPQDDLALLLAESLGTHQPRLAGLLAIATSGADDLIDLDKSVAVMDGATLAGALVYRWNGGDPRIEGNVVAPAYRAGPVNLMQLLAATRNGLAGGASGFTYICDETVIDSVNLARRGGGTLIRSEVDLIRPIRR